MIHFIKRLRHIDCNNEVFIADVWTSAIKLQYNCNTRESNIAGSFIAEFRTSAIKLFFSVLLHFCIFSAYIFFVFLLAAFSERIKMYIFVRTTLGGRLCITRGLSRACAI